MTSRTSSTAEAGPARHTKVLRLVVVTCLSLSGCIPGYDPAPGETVGTPLDTIDETSAPEFGNAPIERIVKLDIPPGALEDVVGGGFTLQARTASPEPFTAVRLTPGGPINGSLNADSVGISTQLFEWTPPSDCDNGCEVEIPVTIEKVGDGDTPSFHWHAVFGFEYTAVGPPDAADGMTAVIEEP